MLFCGIDGGQTSTKCVIGTADGKLVGTGKGGALIHLGAEGGPERFVESITQAISAAQAPAESAPAKTASVEGTNSHDDANALVATVVGATGIFEDTIESREATSLLSASLNSTHLQVYSDALIALMGAHGGRPGIMIISGTGTIGYGQDALGSVQRAGGWGWPLGDHGSAFAIGRSGLRAALHGADRLAPKTALTDVICAHFDVASVHDIKRLYFAPEFDAPRFAALAPLVATAAQTGDIVAKSIIVDAGAALANQAVAVASKLNFATDEIPVAPVGGAFGHLAGLTAAFEAALSDTRLATGQRFRNTQPQFPPQVGAYIMALKQAGQPISDQLLSSVKKWVVAMD